LTQSHTIDGSMTTSKTPLKARSRFTKTLTDQPPVVVEAADPTPTNRPPTQLDREQILDATATCLAQFGYDGTTIRRIVKQLGCANGSIYRYFKDKRSILSAVVQRRFEGVIEAAEAGNDVGLVADAYIGVALAEPEQYRLMFWLSSLGQPRAAESLPRTVRVLIEAWTKKMGDERSARAVWVQVHGAVLMGRRFGESVDHAALRPATPAAIAQTVNAAETKRGSTS
jgi:AcrR family transcriptional regulator